VLGVTVILWPVTQSRRCFVLHIPVQILNIFSPKILVMQVQTPLSITLTLTVQARDLPVWSKDSEILESASLYGYHDVSGVYVSPTATFLNQFTNLVFSSSRRHEVAHWWLSAKESFVFFTLSYSSEETWVKDNVTK